MAGRGRRAGKSVAAKNQSAAARRAQQRLGKTVVTSAKDAPPEEADDAPNLKKLPLLKKTGVTTITKTAPGSSEQHVHSDSDSDILEITEVKPSRSRSPSPSQGLVYGRFLRFSANSIFSGYERGVSHPDFFQARKTPRNFIFFTYFTAKKATKISIFQKNR